MKKKKTNKMKIKNYHILGNDTPSDLPKLDNEMVWKDATISELSDFLKKYYCCSDKFRLCYQEDFLNWYLKDSHIVSICSKSGTLIGNIIGAKTTMIIDGVNCQTAEINLLCVHPIFRSNSKFGLVYKLIDELSRRLFKDGIEKLIYTNTEQTKIPKPITSTTYYHRIINCKKLMKYQFCNQYSDRDIEKRKLTKKTSLRLMKSEEIEQVYELYCKNTNKIRQYFTLEEFKYKFLSEFIKVYVIEKNNVVTDFISYYRLDRLVIENKDWIKEGSIYYYYFQKNSVIHNIINDLICIMENDGMDLLSAIDIMDEGFLSLKYKLYFEKGTHLMYYYLLNHKCKKTSDVKYVMY